jgi:hypothetical protein
MVAGLLNLIFGSKNDREINELRPIVAAINALESSVSALSDAALADKSVEFRKRHENGESLDDLLPEAFAVCREMSKRVLSMRHFDVQLMGGMILHRGRIAEMKTGEGKTLVATLARSSRPAGLFSFGLLDGPPWITLSRTGRFTNSPARTNVARFIQRVRPVRSPRKGASWRAWGGRVR